MYLKYWLIKHSKTPLMRIYVWFSKKTALFRCIRYNWIVSYRKIMIPGQALLFRAAGKWVEDVKSCVWIFRSSRWERYLMWQVNNWGNYACQATNTSCISWWKLEVNNLPHTQINLTEALTVTSFKIQMHHHGHSGEKGFILCQKRFEDVTN